MLALFEQTKYSKYYISDKGEIFSSTLYHSDGKLHKRKSCLNKKRGYLYTRTTTNNYKIHRLVACAFIDNPENKSTVNHKNGNKLDNRKINLEWNTHKENIRHAIAKGLKKQYGKNEKRKPICRQARY